MQKQGKEVPTQEQYKSLDSNEVVFTKKDMSGNDIYLDAIKEDLNEVIALLHCLQRQIDGS